MVADVRDKWTGGDALPVTVGRVSFNLCWCPVGMGHLDDMWWYGGNSGSKTLRPERLVLILSSRRGMILS
jgi:hypothetical protein